MIPALLALALLHAGTTNLTRVSTSLTVQQPVKPKAAFIVSGCVPSLIVPNATTCVFDGSKSTPRIKLWTWDWGTGKAKETHPFAANKNTFPPGKYTIKLIVTDSLGVKSNPSQLTMTFPLAVKPPVVKPPATKPETVFVDRPGRVDTLRLPGRTDTLRLPGRVDTVYSAYRRDTVQVVVVPGVSPFTPVPPHLLPAGVSVIECRAAGPCLIYRNGKLYGRLGYDAAQNWTAYRYVPGATVMRAAGLYTSQLAAIVALTGP